jgi:hypothetical protein
VDTSNAVHRGLACVVVWVCVASSAAFGAASFDSPGKAADALIAASEAFDVNQLTELFGPGSEEIFLSGEEPQDRRRASEFATKARERKRIVQESESETRVHLVVGQEMWPFPVPIVKKGGTWSFDANEGREELLRRRIGANELDAIGICRGYVDAQYEYAVETPEDRFPKQYAQRILSTPGKRDGLAWRNEDGTWGGPVGEKIAHAIEQGYTRKAAPYHGYYFKVLKGQGPAARLGELDFVVKGVMIGGFALVAAPAEYGSTGVKTFLVSHEGIVYEKDLGPTTLDEVGRMERFNPDPSWTPVAER